MKTKQFSRVLIMTAILALPLASEATVTHLPSPPCRNSSVTGTPAAPTTASIHYSAGSGSCIKAEPEYPGVTFLAGQPMLISTILAP